MYLNFALNFSTSNLFRQPSLFRQPLHENWSPDSVASNASFSVDPNLLEDIDGFLCESGVDVNAISSN